MEDESDIHVIFNMFWEKLEFEIPSIKGRRWFLAVNTAQESPFDIFEEGHEQNIDSNTFTVQGRSIIIFVSK